MHGVNRSFGPGVSLTVVVACAVLIALGPSSGELAAQQASAQADASLPSSAPAQSGPIEVPWECVGLGVSPYWDDPVMLTLTPAINNQAGNSETFYGDGAVDGSISGTFQLGRPNVTLGCLAHFYSSWAGSADDGFSVTIPGRTPDALYNDESVETFSYTGPGNYLRIRQYFVKDQYDWIWGFEDSVVEEWDVQTQNTCGLQIYTGEATTNNVGRFVDYYGNLNQAPDPIPQCHINPSCQSDFQQYITVGGVTFDHAVTFRCNDVQISR